MGYGRKVPKVFSGEQLHCLYSIHNNSLSHLSSVKLGATEQWWAAQLVAFDFELKYLLGQNNRNADSLSQQHLMETEGALACAGTALPDSLQAVILRKLDYAGHGYSTVWL